MRHICNGDEKAKTILICLAPDGVIKISGVLSVDGDKWQSAQVFAV